MKYFQVLTYPEEAELALSRAVGVARERTRETARIETAGCTIVGGEEAKTEIPVEAEGTEAFHAG
jgi:hypothetical protein